MHPLYTPIFLEMPRDADCTFLGYYGCIKESLGILLRYQTQLVQHSPCPIPKLGSEIQSFGAGAEQREGEVSPGPVGLGDT